MRYDGQVSIATGLSMFSKIWKNEKISWTDLVKRLSEAVKTNETFKEYNNANKDEKSKIKDVGGYVGGYLRAGRRKPENVVHRQLLTLDIDYAHNDFWDDFMMQFDNAAVLHATHSHTDKSPRYRLIMPLSREVQSDEYSAISRKIAGTLNIELFDNTTFETNRLMFWPSVSHDVDYYFRLQDGPWIDADEILNSYEDWRDSSSWPTSIRNLQEVRDLSKKQQDPDFKKGIVGAFCRTYTITEAIAQFLSDLYSEVNDSCYTYIKGSTSGGLKIYDEKFAYSHHGTDPCGGKLCNAFDLVRIHRFGHLDSDDENSNKSFKAMEDFARIDEKVKHTIALENIQDSRYDFAAGLDDDEEPEELSDEDMEWVTQLEIDTKGNYTSTSNNLNLIFQHDKRIKKAFRYNSFDNRRYVWKKLPWRKLAEIPEPIKNSDYSGVRNYLEGVYGISSPLKIEDALTLEFERNSYNPVKEYLDSLQWDGVPRIDKILVEYFGCTDNVYHREAIRKTLVAAVARIYSPGIKYDLVLTLVGNQGTGKSTFVRKIGHGWSSDSFLTVNGKEAFEQLQGSWIIEMAELSGIRKADIEAIKHFISKQDDIFRPAYMRSPEVFPRQCIFIGTTNNHNFLSDPTGNRRFMPVDILEQNATKSVFEITDEQVDQYWAEARHYYFNNEKLYLTPEASYIAKQEQIDHSQHDERQGLIQKYLDVKLPPGWDDMTILERQAFLGDPLSQRGTIFREVVCIAEIWCECLGRNKEDMDRYKTRDLNEIMKTLDGWEQVKSSKYFKLYGRQKYYSRTLD